MNKIELIQGREHEVKVLELKGYCVFDIKQRSWHPQLRNVDGSVQTMQWKGTHFEFNDGKHDWYIHIDDVRVLGMKSDNPADVMFYSYEERKKMRSVLIRGMKNLAMNRDDYNSGQMERFVCFACNQVQVKKSHGAKAVKNVRKFINHRIEQSCSIREWLFEQGINVGNTSFEDLQDYRKRWMQSMIAELEATL
jgi:hypothetical protein